MCNYILIQGKTQTTKKQTSMVNRAITQSLKKFNSGNLSDIKLSNCYNT